jgi:RNA polymerase-binding transcription factor DksA
MATKKPAPKKGVKAASPAKSAPAKPKGAATKVAVKTAPKKGPVKAAPKKGAAKAAPQKGTSKGSVAKKAAPKAAPAKSASAPAKKQAPAPAKKVAEPVKVVASKAIPAKAAPKAAPAPVKPAEVTKKPTVAAPTTQEVKPAIKPLAPRKEEKRTGPVVIPKTSTTKAVKYEPDFTKSVLDIRQQQQSGPTMRYSDAELTEFRELIMKKLETAKKELAYLQGLITRKDEGGDMEDGRYMTMEDGSMSMEREQLSQMASRQIQFIDHLEKAIMRIENKTYGICRVTGKLIDKARLRAVPHATLSIEAKQMMNK